MLASYIEAAMRHVYCEILEDDGSHYCEIPVCLGVWSNEATIEATLADLRGALEGWIELGLALNHPLPEIDGVIVRQAVV